jgi:hypothetical protein
MDSPVIGYDGTRFNGIRVLALGKYVRELAPDVLQVGTHWKFQIVGHGACDSSQAAQLVRLWNALPEGMTARCHMPGYAFQLLLDGEIVFTAALCWQCNNVSFAGRLATGTGRTFDGSTEQAIELLRLCEAVTAIRQ